MSQIVKKKSYRPPPPPQETETTRFLWVKSEIPVYIPPHLVNQTQEQRRGRFTRATLGASEEDLYI
eukprot:CAMPEP_0180188162 /NCGR_PEP_ID=MMETSP0986-20121125/43947_1 /TAXON_ID=697907 /ORGANISM="non described non described, Strain CCMP2293" /LENGTH=65 /DNA_ID=CAMNT_0022142369 /DNA_START=14 /DNA_END=208 /DNA_ORIENTATION=-